MDVRDLFRLIVFKGERWGGICGVLFYYEDEIDRSGISIFFAPVT